MFKVWLAGLLALQHLGLSVAEQRVFDAFYPDDVNPDLEKLTVSPEFEKWVEELVKANNIPGLSLGVMHGDYLEFGAWGIKNEDGDKMTPDTLFGIASCSKAFLATSVGILMDDFAHGRNVTPLPPNLDAFDWLTPVQDVLPGDWKLMDEWANSKAKMRDILSHQSGVPRHEFSYRRNDKPLDVVRRMRHLRPAFELRQRYHYNNQMYMLGAHIVTTYSGISYPQFVKERIWDKLGMSQSTFSAKEAAKNGKLTQAWHLGKRLIPFWNSDDLTDLNGGPGGIMSSATDLMKWVRTLLNKGVNPATNETVIPLMTFEEITTAHTIVDGRATEPYFSIKGYGMGWNRDSYQGYEVLEHGGAIPGFSAEIFFLPSENLGIVALANGDMKHAQENAIAYRVMEDFLGLPRKASEKFLTQTSVSSASDTPAPRQETPLALALSSYAGSYHDEGYGTLTLCAPSSSSPHCIRVLDAFASFENTTNPETPTLYASINSLWIDHIRFRHLHDHTFSLIGSQLFPNGYGKNTTAFEMLEDSGQEVTVEFVVCGEDVEGFGLKGFVRETTELERRGGSVKEVAEVWFERIEWQ